MSDKDRSENNCGSCTLCCKLLEIPALQKPEGQCCELVGQDIKDTQTLGVGVSAGLRREDVKLREAFNKALAGVIGDGTFKKLNDKYFPFSLN